MAFCFFTMGGKQFWEDVFFYQKWRIQRHWRTKKYRLLDKWDICRATGTFEECRKSLVKMIEAYEIKRQSGKLVILIHGLGESKNVFRPLWRYLESQGFNVAAINYPSTKKSMKAHLDQLDFFLTHTEDVSEVSFITKGTGCLLLRYLLATSFEWNKKFKIGKVININPANCGSGFCSALYHFKLFRFLLGPALKDCTPYYAQRAPRLSAQIPTGLIFCETYLDKILRPIFKRYEGIHIPGEPTEEDFADQHIYVKNVQLNVFDNTELLEKCVSFLKNGKF